jgi:hypothetical protein
MAASTCGLAQPAFCDPLTQPTVNGPDDRSGDLDGLVWGVSRGTSADSVFQGGYNTWSAATATICGTTSTLSPDKDVRICNGTLFDTVNDGGASTLLAMYPRQPFDIAGRTGTVAFDLSADGLCNHCAWPNFEYTDQPVPAPGSGSNSPRNGFGFSLWQVGVCPTGQQGVGQMWVTTNYTTSLVNVTKLGCVVSGAAGLALNHFEVRLSQTHAEVWATDAGQSNLHAIASATVSLAFTRGLVWMQDSHYNANKDSNQGTHTFAWANFGFDGPVLSRDLGFDVKDFENSGGASDERLGYLIYNSGSIKVNNVTSPALTAANAALLEFTYTPHNVEAINYAVNGHAAHTAAWPYPDNATYTLRTTALPVPLSELIAGTNTISLSTAPQDIFDVANIDLILVGAGGVPGQTPTATPTITPLPTRTPLATRTPTLTPTATVVHSGKTPGRPNKTPQSGSL